MALGHGAADQFAEDGVLAVEVEVEAAAGNAGGGEDVADSKIAEVVVGEQAGGRGQDGLAQVQGAAAGRSGASALLPAGRDPAAAAAWYGSVLGAAEAGRVTLPGGQVLTIELRFGDSTLAIADEFPAQGIVSPLTLGGTHRALHLAVQDADAVWQRALQAGATVFEPLHDAFWGERTGQFIDPFGHRWAVDQHIRDVPHDEVARLAAAAFGEGSG